MDLFTKPIYSHGKHHGYKIKFKHLRPICKLWPNHATHGHVHLATIEGEGLICYYGASRLELDEGIIDILFNATQADINESIENIQMGNDIPNIYSMVFIENSIEK